VLKKAALFIAVTYSIALVVVSLINLSEMPKVNLNYGDKIFHFLAYGLLCLLWSIVFSLQNPQSLNKAIIKAIIIATIFGILLEVLQGTLTAHRSLDVYDAIANSLGAITVGSLLWVKAKLQVKN
jgi:VanZ family protein